MYHIIKLNHFLLRVKLLRTPDFLKSVLVVPDAGFTFRCLHDVCRYDTKISPCIWPKYLLKIKGQIGQYYVCPDYNMSQMFP